MSLFISTNEDIANDKKARTYSNYGEETLMEIKGLKALVVGLGRSGLSASRFLNSGGAVVKATDMRALEDIEGAKELEKLGIEIEAGGHDLGGIDGTELVVVSPGVPSDIPLLKEARARGVEVISELELATRFIEEPIVAVTGTNGKTTTATLLGEVFCKAGKSVFVGGNIGTPAIEYVMSEEKADICVLEVSSFHLENISLFKPDVAVLLNITEDHLYRYADFMGYIECKFNIFMNQDDDDVAIINAGDPVVGVVLSEKKLAGRVIPFDATGKGEVKGGLYLKDGALVFDSAGKEERYDTSGFTGVTSLENVMAVMATARAMDIDGKLVIETLNSFAGLPHRMERVGEASGVSFINDSKATNVGAVVNALSELSGQVVLIAGGVDKGCDYGELKRHMNGKVRLAILTGESREKMAASLGDVTETVTVERFDDAVREAAKRATSGDTVLLSPACSSFDEFTSFSERGERFKKIVGEL